MILEVETKDMLRAYPRSSREARNTDKAEEGVIHQLI